MTGRIARDRRRAGVHVVLRERDEAIVRAVARFRLARTEDIVRLFFPTVRRDTAARRLRRLHDGGFIQARSDGLSSQNLYQLGPVGLRWAEDSGIAASGLPGGNCEHHLGVVRLWAGLAASLRGHSTLRLARFEPDWELRARCAGSGVSVVPDAAVEIVHRQGGGLANLRVALEADLTTERAGTLQRKLSAYDLAPYFPGADPTLLVAVLFGAGERRRTVVRDLVVRAGVGESLVCSESEWPEILLQRLLVTPPTGSPHGKGSPAFVTAPGSMPSSHQGEGPSR